MMTTTITLSGLLVTWWPSPDSEASSVLFKADDVYWSEVLEKCFSQMKGQKLWELIQSSKHLSVFSEKFWYDDPQITIEISQWRTMVLGSNFEKLAIMAEKNPYLFSLVRAFDLDYDLPEFHGSTNG